MITVDQLIQELKKEDQERLIRRVEVLFEDRDRFVLLRGHVHMSSKLRQEKKQKGEFVDDHIEPLPGSMTND